MTVREAKTCVHGTCTDERQARIRRLNDELRRYVRRGDQDENAPSNRMRIGMGYGGAGRSPEPP